MKSDEKSILIIEDHDVMRLSLVHWLREIFPEFNIYSTATGEVGFSMAKELNPDIALVDIGLPGISGLEVLSKMIAYRCRTKVIIVTMLEKSDHETKSYHAGAYQFMHKTDMYKQLPSVIQSIVRMMYEENTVEE